MSQNSFLLKSFSYEYYHIKEITNTCPIGISLWPQTTRVEKNHLSFTPHQSIWIMVSEHYIYIYICNYRDNATSFYYFCTDNSRCLSLYFTYSGQSCFLFIMLFLSFWFSFTHISLNKKKKLKKCKANKMPWSRIDVFIYNLR